MFDSFFLWIWLTDGAFEKEHDHTLVPQWSGPLVNLVRKQQAGYRKMRAGKKTPTTAEKALQLSEIGFNFNPWDSELVLIEIKSNKVPHWRVMQLKLMGTHYLSAKDLIVDYLPVMLYHWCTGWKKMSKYRLTYYKNGNDWKKYSAP